MDLEHRYCNSGWCSSRQVCRVPCQQNQTIHRSDNGQRKGYFPGRASMHCIVLVPLPGRTMGGGLDICWFPDTCCHPIAVKLPWYILCSCRKRTRRVSSASSRPTRTRDQAKDVVDDNPFRSNCLRWRLGTRSWLVARPSRMNPEIDSCHGR